ncbi:GNAT family N-acetyltransferase [Clostridium mediterraneense]|uniref:GNAT family N-acetyltransferase n=1 Tax=Clostridium mediterraneense TaxID=1805472 RepID=UPI00082C2069|nr:GNAT family N-acetyltransferase [Clostridium mediterraneense]
MDIKLLTILDFFSFRKELKKTLEIGILKYIKLLILNKYIFIVTYSNGYNIFWETKKINSGKFLIYKIYKNKNKLNKTIKSKNYRKDHFIYICNDKEYNLDNISDWGFKERNCNLYMKINLKNFNIDKLSFDDINFEKLILGLNDIERCNIQNEAFFKVNRIPLNLKDIKYEVSRNCFLEDLSYFIKMNDEYIGYGQVMDLNGRYTVANLCIKNKFQGQGYGKILLKYLLLKCFEQNIYDIYIKVSSDNTVALSLYKKIGFKVIENQHIFEIKS